MLLDTNVLILYISGSLEKNILDKVNYEIVLKNAYINQIIIAEVLAYNLYSDKQAKEIEMFIYKKFKILKINKTITSLAAKIVRNKRNNTGKKLKLTDALIAATSIFYNKKFLSFDKEDFSNIENLEIFS
jgi:predicted nucleic acid-binding protein